MGEVIQFPKKNKSLPSLSVEEIQLKQMKQAVQHVDSICKNAISQLYQSLAIGGLDITQKGHTSDISLIIEAVRSATLNLYGIGHPLQEFAKNEFPLKKKQIIIANDDDPPNSPKGCA